MSPNQFELTTWGSASSALIVPPISVRYCDLSMTDWHLTIGDRTTRADVAARYGGSRFPGISPSTQSPNIFIYSDKDEAAVYGYSYGTST